MAPKKKRTQLKKVDRGFVNSLLASIVHHFTYPIERLLKINPRGFLQARKDSLFPKSESPQNAICYSNLTQQLAFRVRGKTLFIL